MPKSDGTIGIAERKEIRKFTDQEFDNLRNSITSEASRLKTEARAKVQEEESKEMRDFLQTTEALKKKARLLSEEVSQFVVDASLKGFKLAGGYRNSFISVSIGDQSGWEKDTTNKKIREAESVVDAELRKALNAVAVKRTESERKLLEAALEPGVAKDFLNAIPTLSEVFMLDSKTLKQLSK